uniref:Arachidonate 15-lipoxygenase B n=1 Tax=Fundulus heteroclitus TaxID=8078 RepID=A0A3Q2QGI0_FUNHE
MGQEKLVGCHIVSGLEVAGLESDLYCDLPDVFTQKMMPVCRSNIPREQDLVRWPYLRGLHLPEIDADIELLIGLNAPRALEPIKVIPSKDGGPYAVQTMLSWTVNGPICGEAGSEEPSITANCISVVKLDELWKQQFQLDFPECSHEEQLSPSREDRQFMEMVNSSIKLMDGHYTINLPLKKRNVCMPDNRKLVEQRALSLKRKFVKDASFHAVRPCFPDYVHDHWKEDSFFGYQFLNGVNPMVIRRCPALPQNFPVTDEMVFKGSKQRLKYEMKKGNIFLCDYKILDGVKANIINGKQQYLVAPLVLLHKTPDDKLMPIAIQLKQTPAEDNPIFLPTDSEWDWLLAKTFVRNADLNLHQLSFHLLRTHLLAEVFTVALLRHLPMMHPLYKLLMPHTRYTLMINFLARKLLISDTGMLTILREALSSVTYRSLCLPDDISDRGLEDVPNFYYRDDGLKLWNIIYRFVKGTLSFYYKDDKMVQDDQALQEWIYAIYSNGFTNIPMRLNTVKELLKFVTMVIFTCSAQHSAVNSGQYDFIGWMPNTPVSLEGPPPSRKGEATEATMLDTLPSIDVTVHGMATVWLLSKQSSDSEYLGNYPEQRFTDKVPLEKIKTFKQQLKKLHKQIKKRNKHLKPPYTYLDPKVVENSVSL